MKSIRIISLLTVLALVMALVPSALAGPQPGNWVSGIACQNLSDTDPASVTLYFYQQDSSDLAMPPYEIQPASPCTSTSRIARISPCPHMSIRTQSRPAAAAT